MTQIIFVNLPVTDLARSKAFYEAIGAINNPQFTDDNAAMMSFSPEVNVMLLTHDKWRQFTSKAIPDANTHCSGAACFVARQPRGGRRDHRRRRTPGRDDRPHPQAGL